MTIVEMGEYFDLLQDKFSSPYFLDTEKTTFLQRAHVGFVRDLVFPEERQDKTNIEMSQDTISQISPLIIALPSLVMAGTTGLITKATIQSTLTAASAGALLWRPLNIGWTLGGDNRPVKYVRHNDIWEFRSNYFKNPSNDNPKVTETAVSYVFLPVNTQAKIYFTVLKYPRKVVLDTVTPANNIESDLPDFTHDRVVALALEYAGICSRDEALAQLLTIKR